MVLLTHAALDHIPQIPQHGHIRQLLIVDQLLPHARLVALHRHLGLPRLRHRQPHPLASPLRVILARHAQLNKLLETHRVLLPEQAENMLHWPSDVQLPDELLQRQ